MATKEAKENRIGMSPTTIWQRPCIQVAVCLSINQGKLLKEHKSVQVGGRKGRVSDDESRGAQLPKSKVSVRKVVDSEECHNTAKVDLPIVKKEMQVVERGEEATMSPEGLSYPKAKCKATDSRTMGLAAPWYRRGGTSMESSIPCSHGGRALVVKGAEEVENAKAISKYQDKAKGQRPRNFIKLVSTIVLNRRPPKCPDEARPERLDLHPGGALQ
ncbi:hypothetical protein GW17_00034067 [Ensete ventricosum]|nr:hypothetical protein GW17_00034067 [Ensete ventricosum]